MAAVRRETIKALAAGTLHTKCALSIAVISGRSGWTSSFRCFELPAETVTVAGSPSKLKLDTVRLRSSFALGPVF